MVVYEKRKPSYYFIGVPKTQNALVKLFKMDYV
jgi:hypothetical protein